MPEPRNIIDERFGSLVVKRQHPDGTLFCVCEPETGRCYSPQGEGTRTVSRTQLTSRAIQSCSACAVAHKLMCRRGNGNITKPNTEPSPEPKKVEPKPKPIIECVGCTTRIIDRVSYLCVDVDCPKHSPMYKVEEGWQRRSVPVMTGEA
jgi:hypothetical protein